MYQHKLWDDKTFFLNTIFVKVKILIHACMAIMFLLTGAQTRFTFELPNHRLRFTSKVSATDMSTIPPSASLNLPPVTMSGKYIMEEHDSYSDQVWSIDELPSKQGYYLQGNYLRCVAEVSLLSKLLFCN